MAMLHQAGVLLFLLESVSSLRMEVYPNAGFGGTPVVTTIEDVNNITWPGTPSTTEPKAAYFLRARILHKPSSNGTTATTSLFSSPPSPPASITALYTRVSPNPKPAPSTYVGCYKDGGGGQRDLPFNAGDNPNDDSPAICGMACKAYTYFGLQDGDNCFCGNSYGSQGKASESDCNMPCPQHFGKVKKVMCGAANRNSIYSHTASPAATPNPIPSSSFSDVLQPAQMQRLNMSTSLTHGRWNTWAKASVTAHILLPAGIMLKFGICQLSTKQCKEDGTKGDIDSGVVRLGPHAHDHSYTQLYIAYNGFNMSVETSQLNGQPDAPLVVQATAVAGASQNDNGHGNRSEHGAANNNSDFALVLIALFTDVDVDQASWNLPGDVHVDASKGAGTITATPLGTGIGGVTVNGPKGEHAFAGNLNVNAPDWLAWQFGSSGVLSVTTGGDGMTPAAVASAIAGAKATELATYAAYGDLAEAKEASQAGMMWNVQWSPDIPGTFAPVSRGWGRPWVIFDWDNIFGAYQLALDAKELAYSQLAAVIKTKTAEGMVPNFWQPQSISYDRTEPMIGSKVLHAMFHKYKEPWIVELLYGDLYDWQDWFFRNRVEPPLNLICLGSTPNLPTGDTPNMQAARYESGLDDSPMYDGEFYNTTSNHMELYDVGMSSMVAMELEALANLSLTAFNPPRTADHAVLTSRLTDLSKLISTHLWDAEHGIFTNKFSSNGSFYRRISPTSFYPMQAGIATEEQANTMVDTWLMNASRFCVSPKGDFAGNSPGCWWGLPSISADDPSYPASGYWRGHVWGPMLQLTYWGLAAPKYADLPAVTQGRKALAKQATSMLSNVWRRHRHVCENFGERQDENDCTGDKFYHWGGLAGFISLLEEGYF
eukprot:gene13321-31113_t